ncbi:hypothetical protein [Marinobacterium rhizophilum]|uniref:hypothetical protein n=1 Tax=Marinobacterium rhizophilum TaxID=420402 RepID=UPI0012EBE6BD|nr:hypothetical protein [Marinobacterium rhizophilum]
MSKFEIAVSTLLLGFILGQAVDFIKYRWAIHRKKKGVVDEISDICEEFAERFSRIETILHEINNVEVSGSWTPSVISSVIYERYYADVAPFFSRKERKSIDVIYSCVSNFNDEVENGKRNSLQSTNNSLISLYASSRMGHGSAVFFEEHRGEKLLSESKDELAEINKSIQQLAEKYYA